MTSEHDSDRSPTGRPKRTPTNATNERTDREVRDNRNIPHPTNAQEQP
jgi:hypothetical protein